MKKRLRKKYHLEEYQMLGASIYVALIEDLNVEQYNHCFDDFITDAIEYNGLQFGGGGTDLKSWCGVIEPRSRYGSVSDEDLAKIRSWLSNRSEVSTYTLSELWDLFHDDDPLIKIV